MRAFALLLLLGAPANAAMPGGIAAFNTRFEQATREMNTAALADLWEEDG